MSAPPSTAADVEPYGSVDQHDSVAPYDMVVVGAGAGGLAAARAARRAGRRTALVDRRKPGGDCTWYGCVPSKALLETARIAADARTAGPRGVRAKVEVDLPAVLERVRATRELVYTADESYEVLAAEGIDVLAGDARFATPHVVEVHAADGSIRALDAAQVILALGAAPKVPPPLAGVPHLTTDTVWNLTVRPQRLVVLGGGPVGCELAQAFARLGCAVVLVEGAARLLARLDPEAAGVLLDALRADGVDVRLGVAVQEAAKEAGDVRLGLADGTSVRASHVLVAAGRAPRTSGLGLEVAGVAVRSDGLVETDARLRTTAPHVWAVGDCATPVNNTHVADEMGRLAVRNALVAARSPRWRPPSPTALPARWSEEYVPQVVYTDPEVAQVGLDEHAAAGTHGDAARVVTLPMSRVDRARCAGRTEGFVKLVAVPQGRLLRRAPLRLRGATVVAPTAGELLAALMPAVKARSGLARLASTIVAYPTWALSLRMAAAAYFTDVAGADERPAQRSP